MRVCAAGAAVNVSRAFTTGTSSLVYKRTCPLNGIEIDYKVRGAIIWFVTLLPVSVDGGMGATPPLFLLQS